MLVAAMLWRDGIYLAVVPALPDALGEAALVLAMLAATSITMSISRRKRRALRSSKQGSKVNTSKQMSSKDSSTRPGQGGSGSRSAPASSLVAGSASTKTSGNAARRQYVTSAGQVRCVAPRAQPGCSKAFASGPPTRAMQRAMVKHQCDALAAAVSAGRAAALPDLLDAAIAQTFPAKIGDEFQEQRQECVVQYLVSAVRACASNRRFYEALAAYDHLADRVGLGSATLWSVLLYNAVEAGALERCQTFFQQLSRQAIPAGNDVVNMVRCFARARDCEGLERMLADLSELPNKVDAVTWNRALSACASEGGCLALAESLVAYKPFSDSMDTISYNTLMTCYARAGILPRCFELHVAMESKGIQSNEVTFGILLEVCVEMGDLDKAKHIFDDLRNSGLHRNVVHCTSFIKVLVHTNRMDEARAVLDEMMHSSAVKPDLITYVTFVRAYIGRGDLAAATEMLHQMSDHGFQPDVHLYNNLVSGCLTHKLHASEVNRIWNELLALGMKPTSVILSMYLVAIVQHEEDHSYGLALDTLEGTLLLYGDMEDEVRLFVQLIQSCIRGGKGDKALEAYAALLRCTKRCKEAGRPPDEGLVGLTDRLVRYCSMHNAADTGTKLQIAATSAGVDQADTQKLAMRDRRVSGGPSPPWRMRCPGPYHAQEQQIAKV